MEQTLLSIEHLKKSYDDNLILDDIDLEVHQGEVIVLVGPSGCGKSTGDNGTGRYFRLWKKYDASMYQRSGTNSGRRDQIKW